MRRQPRRLLGVAVLAAAPLLWRRRRESRRDHVGVAFDDGSFVRLERGPDAQALLAVARQAL